jgi:serine/threonine-protein kinase RsbW
MPLAAHIHPPASRNREPTPEPAWPLVAGLGPLGALTTAPRLIRRFTTMILASWDLPAMTGNPDLADTAELIASELASNVVRAATDANGNPRYDADARLPVLWLRLLSDRARLQIEVWDDLSLDYGMPEPRAVTADDENGRGLALIRELSQACGWNPVGAHNAKRVWALLSAWPGRVPTPGNLTLGGTTPMKGNQCLCGYQATSDDDLADHLGELLIPGNDMAEDGQFHAEAARDPKPRSRG